MPIDHDRALRAWMETTPIEEVENMLVGLREVSRTLEDGLARIADERCAHLVNGLTVPHENGGE